MNELLNSTLLDSLLMPIPTYNNMFKEIDTAFNTYKTNIPYNVAHIADDDNQIVSTRIEVALAGYSKDDIKIKVNNNELQILVEKTNQEKDEDHVKYIHKGIAERSSQLKFKLVSGYDVKKIKSLFKNGMLNVEVPVNTENIFDVDID